MLWVTRIRYSTDFVKTNLYIVLPKKKKDVRHGVNLLSSFWGYGFSENLFFLFLIISAAPTDVIATAAVAPITMMSVSPLEVLCVF